jgi:alkyl hydroperoxide reductase subunit F
MLEQAMKDQLRSLFESIQNTYLIKVGVEANHSEKENVVNLITDFASCSDKINFEVTEQQGLNLTIYKNGVDSNILFRAVPTGHEFTTLILAILNQEGIGKNLPDELLKARISGINKRITLKSYISLSCTNCPEVVQALNILSFVNPNIRHEIIDGSINKDEVESLNIQSVPSVYLENELLHVGRSSLGELLTKIEDKIGQEFTPQITEKKSYDVIVAGGGPAGVSAAIYSARKGFSVAIIAEKIGGQVNETVSIENMISVNQTTGSQLSANMKNHLSDYAIDIYENRLVENVELNNGLKIVKSTLGEIFETPALIIATGASWRKLGVPGEEKYIGSGVAFCTHCDGPFYKDKKVVVIGGGNSGLEAAIDLSSIAKEVLVLEFLEDLKGDQVLQDKINSLDNVSVKTNVQTLRIDGDGSKVTSIKYKDRATEEEFTHITDGVFIQIGLTPNSKSFAEVVETNRFGEIEIDASCRTKTAGIYAAGDVSVVPFKQIIIAMGEGSKAALSAFDDNIKGVV